MLVDVQHGFLARGEFKEVVPVTRLAYTWGWAGSRENGSMRDRKSRAHARIMSYSPMKKSVPRGSMLATVSWEVVSQQIGGGSELSAAVGPAR
jgi:uncharacterized protein YndB with AHSA1/START domain